MKHLRLLTMIAATALLAACGGGDGASPAAVADPDALAEIPASAGASLQAFHVTVAGLADDDRARPLSLEQVLPPTSDTTEPQALD